MTFSPWDKIIYYQIIDCELILLYTLYVYLKKNTLEWIQGQKTQSNETKSIEFKKNFTLCKRLVLKIDYFKAIIETMKTFFSPDIAE